MLLANLSVPGMQESQQAPATSEDSDAGSGCVSKATHCAQRPHSEAEDSPMQVMHALESTLFCVTWLPEMPLLPSFAQWAHRNAA